MAKGTFRRRLHEPFLGRPRVMGTDALDVYSLSVDPDTKVLQYRPFAVKSRSDSGRQAGSVVGRHSGQTVQFVERRFGLLQVGGVKAFGEPVVDY